MTPPLHMPPPGYPVSGSIPVYPHKKVQAHLVTNAARSLRTDNGHRAPPVGGHLISNGQCKLPVVNCGHSSPDSVLPTRSGSCKPSIDGHSAPGSVQPVSSDPCKLPVDAHQHSLPDSVQPVSSVP
ncbi:hypothetical protein DPMN_012621 [Dreissena polymorpha]|uniref:Uncharacterized protein n=1 Tax=Dreissena polymorpha TaxID=45954 RepID=A0A9D4S2Z9_DREPO|nr:hypothetical protein DPMN_012621 [Dreissena polymorpha]